MTYPQNQYSERSAPEKIRQETTTTTVSTTTTTASMPLTSDSEPTYSASNKATNYNRPSTSSKLNNSNHLEIENGRPGSGRSSSLSSNSSANGQTLNHKGSHPGLNNPGSGSSSGKIGIGAYGLSNGSNSSLPSGRGASSSSERVRPSSHDTSDYPSGAHSWPILFAVIPPLGALVFGKADIFSDILTLLLIAFFLYNIIKGKRCGPLSSPHSSSHQLSSHNLYHPIPHTPHQSTTHSGSLGLFVRGYHLNLLDTNGGRDALTVLLEKGERGVCTLHPVFIYLLPLRWGITYNT